MVRQVVQQLPGGNQVKRFRAGVLIAALSVSILAVGCGRSGSDSESGSGESSTAKANANCTKEALQATEIGVSADTITVEVMADTGSPLAPGLFQGNVDAMNAYAKWINANGGVGCRQLKVEAWDSKLDATESKNGIINACKTAVAMVGGNALFNPDVTDLGNCVDKAGQPIGIPNFAALANDVNEQCAANAWIVQAVAEPCTGTNTGVRDLKAFVGATSFYKTVQPNLKGVFLVPGDLPTTVQSSTYQIEAQKSAGVTWIDTMKVSGRAEQSAFNTYVQALKTGGGNYAYMGSNDVAMTKLRKEAKAQGLTGVDVWACSLACYTENFKTAGADVDGTYVWMQFVPFEEASTNKAVQTYVDASGGKPDAFGAQAWQAGMAFTQAVNEIVAEKGANAITRANILEKMKTLSFDADGWIGKARTSPKVFSDCMVIMQINGGKFERVFPKEAGTLDCNSSNVTTVKIDPAAAAANIK
jgi:ABC-type branched-subunit amino acid transport system substrate-binding protein